MTQLTPGDIFWIPDAEHCFVAATVRAVTRQENGDLHGDVIVDGRLKKLSGLKTKGPLRVVDKQSLEKPLDDMVLFNDLNDATLLHNMRRRFDEDNIYTRIGDILVSVNPFKMLPIYDKKYRVAN